MGYWITAALLVVFGFLTGYSIGAPFLLLGLVMVVVGPVRRRARIFWPAMVVVPAFTLGYVLVAPLTCTASAGVSAGATAGAGDLSTTTCTSLLGGPYAGTGVYNPPLEPALRVGVAVAGGAAIVTFVLISLGRSRKTSGG